MTAVLDFGAGSGSIFGGGEGFGGADLRLYQLIYLIETRSAPEGCGGQHIIKNGVKINEKTSKMSSNNRCGKTAHPSSPTEFAEVT